MKTLLIGLILLALGGECQAGEFWTEDDSVTNSTIIISNVLLVMDWAQTRQIAKHPDEFRESGWAEHFIGDQPSTGDVNRYFAAALVLTNAAGYMLPAKATIWGMEWNPKKSFYLGVATIQLHTIKENIEIGLRAEW